MATQLMFQLEPMTRGFGALLNGLDLDYIAPATATQLDESLHRHGVLFIRPGAAGEVSETQLLTLAEAFGEIEVYPYRLRSKDFSDPRLNAIDADREFAKSLGTNIWHTDGTPEECPPHAALLNATMLPERGGDTIWADMAAAYDGLSSRYQRFLDGLEALHTTAKPRRRMGQDVDGDVFGSGSSHVHPVVLTDPVTKRKMLYVNAQFTERLVGLSNAESESVLQMLFAHINTPEFHLRWQWQLNDIAIWEERLTQHRAVADFDGRRILRRIALKGQRPN